MDIMKSQLTEIGEAIADELSAASKSRDHLVDISETELLEETQTGYLYSFRVDHELRLPADVPVMLFLPNGETAPANVMSVFDFRVFLITKEPLPEETQDLKMSSEPWFILQALQERFYEEVAESPGPVVSQLLNMQSEEATDLLPLPQAEGTATSLNVGQNQAMEKCLQEPLHFVWGPPGTGKTATLAAVAKALVLQGRRVLVVSTANAAVDVALMRVAGALRPSKALSDARILRVGHAQLSEMKEFPEIVPDEIVAARYPELNNEYQFMKSERKSISLALRRASPRERKELIGQLQEVRRRISEIQTKIHEITRALMENALLMGVTLSKLVINEFIWSWEPDVVILDEASMATFPFALAAASRAKKQFLMFGDFRQLPPVYVASTKKAAKWLGRDVFEISGIREKIDNDEFDSRLSMLTQQYRMAEPICELVSEFAYLGKLETAPEVVESVNAPLAGAKLMASKNLSLIDTTGLWTSCFQETKEGSFSRVNPVHASLAIEVASDFRDEPECSVGVITPYRAQAHLVQQLALDAGLNNVKVATVHRFQGGESDVVILDLCDAPFQKTASRLTGGDIELASRLLNVAMSRARKHLFILCDVRFVRQLHPGHSPAIRVLTKLEDMNATTVVAAKELSAREGRYTWLKDWKAASAMLQTELTNLDSKCVIHCPDTFELPVSIQDCILGLGTKQKFVRLYARLSVAGVFEDSEIEVKLLTQSGGLFVIIEGKGVLCGGHRVSGPLVWIPGDKAVDIFTAVYFGAPVGFSHSGKSQKS